MRKIRRCWMTVRSSSHSLLRVKSIDNPLLENAYRSRRRDRSFAKAFSLSKRIGNQAGRIAQEEHSQNLARHLTRTGSQCFFFQAEDGIRDLTVTGVQTCALPI